MVGIDYIVIVIYFLGLIGVSVLVSRSIKSSADMFIAGRNSSWWLSGMSTYMTLFSASTFVIWGGVAYRSGIVAALIGVVAISPYYSVFFDIAARSKRAHAVTKKEIRQIRITIMHNVVQNMHIINKTTITFFFSSKA